MKLISAHPRHSLLPEFMPWLLCLALLASLGHAQGFSVLHRFAGRGGGKLPYGGLLRDSDGNAYLTTWYGGSLNMGAVLKIDPQGKETVLHSFWGGDGLFPNGTLIRDEAGNFYGTTYDGGASGGGECIHGCGTVFKMGATGKITVLHAFKGGVDGRHPEGGLQHDNEGNLYGATFEGGNPSCQSNSPGCGVILKLGPNGKESVLHTFSNPSDGIFPVGGVVRDGAGNLYGVTSASAGPVGGTVFKIDPAGTYTVLYSFTGGTDGGEPDGRLLLDVAGNLYGETAYGGDLSDCYPSQGCGVIFKVDSAGKETVLYAFTGKADQSYPGGGLSIDAHGNFYGVAGGVWGICTWNCGIVFKLDRAGKLIVLHNFSGGDGTSPNGDLILDASGNLYGAAVLGGYVSCFNGYGCGVVFRLTP